MVDWCIGRILDKRNELNLAYRALVLSTSDHGDIRGHLGIVCKFVPAMAEHITRVPPILCLPRRIPAGHIVSVRTNSVDIMSTLLDYLGLAAPDGIAGRTLRAFHRWPTR